MRSLEMRDICKAEIEGLVEPNVFDRLPTRVTVQERLDPRQLVTWSRLDIGMRTLYLQLKERVPKLAEKIYHEDIKAQSLGTMVDPDNSSKNGLKSFRDVFDCIAGSIAKDGFDPARTLLPVSSAGSILNGGHRLSAALVHGREVSCVYTNLPPITCDYKYFFDRDVPSDIIERAARQVIRYAENVFVAFLWPSGVGALARAESMFENVIYKKTISLKRKGPFNLLYQCYHHMDWVGTDVSGFQGLQQKQMECFPNGEGEVHVIAFQALGGVFEIRKIKQRIREINGIGYSSVHITDTREEAISLANIVFSDTGLHYLNYAEPITSGARETLERLSVTAVERGVDLEEFIIDGSWLLELYGIRCAEDLDIIASSGVNDVYGMMGFDARDKEIIYHGKAEEELVFDISNHFYLFGVKVIGFRQLQYMKAARGQAKDENDIKLMACVVENRPWQRIKVRLKQRLLYAQLRMRRQIVKITCRVLRKVGLYRPIRTVWRTLSARRHEGKVSRK